VKVDFQQGDWASMSAQARKGKDSPFDAFMQGWSADALDPVLMLDFLFNSRNTASRTSYADSKVDELITKATSTIDRRELDGLLRQIQGMVWEDAPFIFLYVPSEVLGIRKNLKAFTARPDEFFFFTKAYLSN
jgi:peptide/nickel transport system substrate-binding protein